MASRSQFDTFIEAEIEMLTRAEMLEDNGDQDYASAIESEWKGGSAFNTIMLSVDCFVKA